MRLVSYPDFCIGGLELHEEGEGNEQHRAARGQRHCQRGFFSKLGKWVKAAAVIQDRIDSDSSGHFPTFFRCIFF